MRAGFALTVIFAFPPIAAVKASATPEERALAYLAREVPRWAKENKCYSCHNNGDAARALYVARRNGYKLADSALADTSAWLANPAGWDHNGGDGPFSDKQLARLQFAAALADAIDARAVRDETSLAKAAAFVAAAQRSDGSWRFDAEGSVGSPATYGAALATHQAQRVLRKADAARYRDALAKSNRWLRGCKVETVLDAAGVMLGLGKADDDAAATQRRACLTLLRKGQSKSGGWGPYTYSPPEVFDTALVVLALEQHSWSDAQREMMRRGRAFLLVRQHADGSWTETTRPSGNESYAQRISTCGWATLALLKTSARR